MKKVLILSFCSLILGTTNSFAGGYQLNEYSATGLGRAFAGAGIVGDDYSALAFNPAGMTLKGTGGQIGATLVDLRSDVKGYLGQGTTTTPVTTSGINGRARLITTLPSFFAQYKVNDTITLGTGMYTPFGLANNYNKDWFGTTHGWHTQLDVIDFAGAIAVKPVKQLSVGFALIARYVYGNLANTVAKPDGTAFSGSKSQMKLDGWDYGYSFGAMYEYSQDTRFGLSYRTNPDHTVKGDHILIIPAMGVNSVFPGESTMTLPSVLTMSAFHKIGKFGLSATARWTQWSVFDNFIMKSSFGSVNVPEKWKDSWTFAVGTDYYLSPSWTLRAGFAYDPTPVASETFRTARIPDADRYWVSIGASYKYKKMTVDIGYSHLFLKDSKSMNFDKAANSTIYSSYDSLGNMFGVQMQYDF